MKFDKASIRDPDVNNIEGATLLLPDGWTPEWRDMRRYKP